MLARLVPTGRSHGGSLMNIPALRGLYRFVGFAIVLGYFHAGALAAPETPLPEADRDVDEFYARVDRIVSPTELRVTILDEWRPTDKIDGERWPNGKARVKPTERTVFLEDISVPSEPRHQKAALEFLRNMVKESEGEVICSGSKVETKKAKDAERICVTGYVFVKPGGTLNNALVRAGLATTENVLYHDVQAKAKRQRLGIWADRP